MNVVKPAPVVVDPESGETKRLCVVCDGGVLRRSRARNLLERLRRDYGSKRLYRCDRCGWRGWLEFVEHFAGLSEAVPDPDLNALDEMASSETSRATPDLD